MGTLADVFAKTQLPQGRQVPPQKPKPKTVDDVINSVPVKAVPVVLRLAPLVAREKILGVDNTARHLGVGDALVRSRQIMATPAADSAFSLSGGGEVGPFYPGNSDVRKSVGGAMGLTGGRVTPRDIDELASRGFYNPITRRSAFPASTDARQERPRILESAAAQHAHSRGVSISSADDARQYAQDFADAYDFLIGTSKTPNPEIPRRDRFFGGIVFDMLKKPLFARHPLNQQRSR